jgi:hypothetical protein
VFFTFLKKLLKGNSVAALEYLIDGGNGVEWLHYHVEKYP